MNRPRPWRQTLALAGAGLLCAALCLSGRSARASEIIQNPNTEGPFTTIRYSLWGGADEVAETKQICRWFTDKYPDIRVEVSVYPWGQYWTKVQTEMASGIAPDVMAFYSGAFGVWAQRGALMNLDPLVAKSDLKESDFFPAAIGNCRWSGHLYCIPTDIAVWCLVYSKDRMEERGIPASRWPQPDRSMPWDDFISLAKELTIRGPDGNVRQWGMTAGQNWEAVMADMDGGFFLDRQVQPTRSTVAGNAPLRDALIKLFESEYGDAVIEGAAPLSSDSTIGSTDTILTSSRYAMGTTGPWALVQLQKAGVRFGVSPMPHGKVPINLVNVNSVAISSQTKHPDAAFKFLAFVGSQRVQELFAGSLRGAPALKSAVGAFIHNKYGIPGCQAFLQDVAIAKPTITTDNSNLSGDVNNFFTDAGQKIDNAYEAGFKSLPRPNGVLDQNAYRAFVKKMHGAIATIVTARLDQLDQELKGHFAEANAPPPTFAQRVIAPAVTLILLCGLLAVYGVAVRRNQPSRPPSGMKTPNRIGYAFLSPWLFGLFLFTLGPLIAAVLLSFTTWNMVQPPQWVGSLHYARLPADQYFWIGLKKTFLYAILVIPISLFGGLFTAGLLTCRIRGGDLFKAILYLPSLFTGAEAAVLWVQMLNKDHGIVNEMLGWLHIAPINWLDADHAFYSVVMMNLFWIGGSMIIYYAGMKQIPAVLYEAAELDGASLARRFTSITIPMLSPVILFLVIITTIGSFQVFTPALFFASSSNMIGSPNNSLRFYAVNIYDAAFNSLQMGRACTYAVVLFLIIFAVTMVQMKMAKRYVHTEAGD